jgi:hypothetical protein
MNNVLFVCYDVKYNDRASKGCMSRYCFLFIKFFSAAADNCRASRLLYAISVLRGREGIGLLGLQHL